MLVSVFVSECVICSSTLRPRPDARNTRHREILLAPHRILESFCRVLPGNRLCPVLCVSVSELIVLEQTPEYVTRTDIQCR